MRCIWSSSLASILSLELARDLMIDFRLLMLETGKFCVNKCACCSSASIREAWSTLIGPSLCSVVVAWIFCSSLCSSAANWPGVTAGVRREAGHRWLLGGSVGLPRIMSEPWVDCQCCVTLSQLRNGLLRSGDVVHRRHRSFFRIFKLGTEDVTMFHLVDRALAAP